MTDLSTGMPVPVQCWKPPSLGSEIQSTLVPPIAYSGARFEAYGQSVPKEDMGGDLADLVAGGGHDVIAYVADVSGHGMRAGMLMGMIKTAIRYGLMLRRPIANLLGDLNLVLPSVKTPNMFATLSALRFDASSEVEYISAGHVPLLHYRRRTGAIVSYAMSQFPLGMFPGAGYAPRRISYEAGDIFVLVTDGMLEIGDEPDAAVGLEALSRIVVGLAGRPLPEIVEAINREVKRHGTEDDRTVLLIRPIAGNAAENAAEDDAAGPDIPQGRRLNPEEDVPEFLEARWRKLLDDLTAELAVD
jgi:serine phosphatase RsbU (regulator of sigma subunit)